ncbi:MAG: TAXI family TRAP transporter solute-binding subunit [bacterium]|nr:TAXI family TRAP transporter solute-binding subunit [bacterium]
MFSKSLISRAALAALLVAVLAVSTACSGGGPGEGETAAPTNRFLSVGTAPPGGAFFVVGGALAEVLNAHPGASGWQVTAEATKGTQENLRRLDSGELDFALANSAISYFAVRGEGAWEKELPVRVVMTLAPNVALFIAPESGDVKTIADLRGKRVVLGPAGAGFDYFLRPILGAHGLTYDDVSPLNATQAGAVDLLADGSAAAAFLGGAVPTASITQASSSQNITYVPFDGEAVEQLLADYPFFDRATIPAGTYRGLDEDYTGMNVGSMHLVTSAAVDDERVYQVTKTIYENRAEVVEKHPAGKAINPKVVVRDTGTEFHPGAVRFYREIGIWPAAPAGNDGE